MQQLSELYREIFGANPVLIEPLGAHASKRAIYRIHGAGEHTVIGVINQNLAQNRAFVGFSKHFKASNILVPEVYGVHKDGECYLEEDLGSVTLLDLLQSTRPGPEEITPEVLSLYGKAVEQLAELQILGGKNLDYSLCHQGAQYDRRCMLWDMNYFLNSFIREYGVSFDAAKLEKDFETFASFLSQAESEYFMYRDFQARNIMVHKGKLYFIDYQEGRRGPLQYDVASLVYQSKANLPPEARKTILNRYIDAAAALIPLDREKFSGFYHGFIFIRLMQVLGTYGEQGLKGKKEYFKQSIPFALKNLGHLLDTLALPVEAPELLRLMRVIAADAHPTKQEKSESVLSVQLSSFSYRLGMPPVGGEHGGGFVFDCRCITNPGREEQYKEMTGLDQPVRDFLDAKVATDKFFFHILATIEQAIESYQERGFTNLFIAFGCTGGQHRSVYFTERLTAELRKKRRLEIAVKHYGLEDLAKRRAAAAAAK